LGLNVRKPRTRIGAPTSSPDVDKVSMEGHTLRIRLHNSESSTRARPAGVPGATILTYTGDAPSNNVAEWTLVTSTSRTTVDINFPLDLPAGTKVWVTAFWYSPTGESGPAASPISAFIQYGVLSQGGQSSMAIAA